MGVPHPRHQTVGAAPTPAVPGWYKHPYQVEGCGKPALQKTKTLDGGRRAAVCVYIYIYAYPAPRSSASNRLVIRSDRYDPEIPRSVLRSQTVPVWRGKKRRERDPRGRERLMPPSRRRSTCVVPTRVHTAYAAPRRPAPGGRARAPAARGTTHDNAARGRKERDTPYRSPRPPRTLSPRAGLRSREAAA